MDTLFNNLQHHMLEFSFMKKQSCHFHQEAKS